MTNRPKLDAASVSSIIDSATSTNGFCIAAPNNPPDMATATPTDENISAIPSTKTIARYITRRGPPPWLPKYAIVTPISG